MEDVAATEEVRIERMSAEDWPAVSAIYTEGIATGDATFEEEVPAFDAWSAGHLAEHRLVARCGDAIVGWAAASPVSERCVYGGVVEISVYVAEAARGHGVRRRLVEALIESTEGAGIWTLQTGIFPENEVSLRLHRACGFRVVGIRERLGMHRGRWRDVVLLERRSG